MASCKSAGQDYLVTVPKYVLLQLRKKLNESMLQQTSIIMIITSIIAAKRDAGHVAA